MDKYLMVVLVFLFGGIAIAMTRQPFDVILFYSSVAGSVIVLIYAAYKDRKKHQAQKELRKRKYKK